MWWRTNVRDGMDAVQSAREPWRSAFGAWRIRGGWSMAKKKAKKKR